jgi:hypothetical protein
MKKLLMTTAAAIMFAAPVYALDASVGTDTTATTKTGSPTTSTTADTSNTATTTTGVNTTQNSGISLSGKAKVLPHASITTGSNTADTDVRSSTSIDNTTKATSNVDNSANPTLKTRTETSMSDDDDNDDNTVASSNANEDNKSYRSERGKGKKLGHNKTRGYEKRAANNQ